MNSLPTEQEMDEFAETLPYNLASAVFHLNAFLVKGYGDNSRQFAISALKQYKKNPIAFHVHPNHTFLLTYKTTTYPGCLFLYLYRMTVSKCPYNTVANVNKLIEILENAKPSA